MTGRICERRRRWRHLAPVVSAVLLILLPTVRIARADVAPPWYAQGGAVDPDDAPTHVQMVSEEVLLVIEGKDNDPSASLAAELMTGHVEAIFVMRNQGAETETFDVWFPLSSPDGFGKVTSVENFAAWVDGTQAEVEQRLSEGMWGEVVPWATWTVTFPPGQDVLLRVVYDVLPIGYAPYGTFHYILETGAGWWGPIGEGTITFRLPYEVNEYNAVLTLDPETPSDMLPNPTDFTLSGTDVIWRFTELEPAEEDNVRLTVLAPPRWEAIVAAQREVEANPGSAEALRDLASALRAGLAYRYGVWPVGRSTEWVDQINALYRDALELAPDQAEIYIEYLEWMRDSAEPMMETAPEDLRPTLKRALELASDDPRVVEIAQWAVEVDPSLSDLLPASMLPPTQSPLSFPESDTTPSPSSIELPSPMPRPSPSPSPAPTALPALSEPVAEGMVCSGALLALLVPVGLVWLERYRRTHE